MTHSGRLVVIDGTDGSGKKTQAQLLLERLRKDGYPALSFSFPQYGEKSAGLVEEYLNGKYGKPDEVGPYAASLFYALDRFDLSAKIRAALDAGNVVVADRYVTANAGHQGGKITDPSERKKFIAWLYNLEHEILKVPRPDVIIILHVPAEIGQKLVSEKQRRRYLKGEKTHDAHEADLVHLKAAEEAYLWLAKQVPKNHKVIECVKNGKIFSRETIHKKLWQVVAPFLNKTVRHPAAALRE